MTESRLYGLYLWNIRFLNFWGVFFLSNSICKTWYFINYEQSGLQTNSITWELVRKCRPTSFDLLNQNMHFKNNNLYSIRIWEILHKNLPKQKNRSVLSKSNFNSKLKVVHIKLDLSKNLEDRHQPTQYKMFTLTIQSSSIMFILILRNNRKHYNCCF